MARLIVALLLVWQGARFVFRADQRDDLRRADLLFNAGHYYAARATYTAMLARDPRSASVMLRLGIIYAIRNERTNADFMLSSAIGAGLVASDLDLARLYQGRVAESAGEVAQAKRFWSLIDKRSQLFPISCVLQAELALSRAEYAHAEVNYRAALLPELPADWRAFVATRLALLRASSDPRAAQAELMYQNTSVQSRNTGLTFLKPLLPPATPSAFQLATILRSAPAQRAQMLGQVYLHTGLYALAEVQFTSIAPDSPDALRAAVYAAYTRWRTGDQAAGMQQLQKIAAAYPLEVHAQTLLALVYLLMRDTAHAQAQLERVRLLAPNSPDTYVAWARWYVEQHDYLSALKEYRRAVDVASDQQRGTYAFELARFHVESSLQLCSDGRVAAEQATQAQPTHVGAWTLLAQIHLHCGDPNGARVAAEQALQRSPNNAEATYYLGSALLALGERAAGQQALIRAADAAPASYWREQAETQLIALGF